MLTFISWAVDVVEKCIEVVTVFLGEYLDGVGLVGGSNPVLVEIDRFCSFCVGACCTRHGTTWQQLNGGKASRLTLRDPFGDPLQLVRRWAWL